MLGRWGNALAVSMIMSDLIPLLYIQAVGRDREDNIAYGAHLGGYLFGLVVWITICQQFGYTYQQDHSLTGWQKCFWIMVLV